MTTKPNTGWIQPGVPCALYHHSSNVEPGWRVKLHTIERITATQIVIDNGVRFRRDNLKVVGSPYSSTRLLPLDDPRVRNDLAHGRIRDINAAMLRFRDDRTAAAEVLAELRRMVDVAIAESEPGDGVHIEPNRWVVSPFPHDHSRTRHYRVLIERRPGGRYVVTDGMDVAGVQYLDATGAWNFPYGCDDVPGTFWHDWDTAVRLAKEVAIELGKEAAEQERRFQERNGTTAKLV